MKLSLNRRAFSRILFPKPCFLCRRNACLTEVPLCPQCAEAFGNLLKIPCRFCGLPAAECICPQNRKVRFLLWYGQPETNRLVGMLKHHADRAQVKFLAELLAGLCAGRYDAVTYVPRSPSGIKSNGYDQSRLLASYIAKRLELPLVNTLQCRSSLQQKLLSASQREKSMKGRYAAKPAAVVAHQHLLLIDDVCTTGATLRACSALLRKAGAKSVSCATLARTPVLLP